MIVTPVTRWPRPADARPTASQPATICTPGRAATRVLRPKEYPFLYASREGYTDIVKVLINAGVNTKETTKSGGTALISASERGHVEVVKELLEHTDIDVNYKNERGGTALLEAIVLGNGSESHKKVIQMLIDHGADVNMANKENITPLQYAEKRGFKDIANMLRIAGANEVVQPQPQLAE